MDTHTRHGLVPVQPCLEIQGMGGTNAEAGINHAPVMAARYFSHNTLGERYMNRRRPRAARACCSALCLRFLHPLSPSHPQLPRAVPSRKPSIGPCSLVAAARIQRLNPRLRPRHHRCHDHPRFAIALSVPKVLLSRTKRPSFPQRRPETVAVSAGPVLVLAPPPPPPTPPLLVRRAPPKERLPSLRPCRAHGGCRRRLVRVEASHHRRRRHTVHATQLPTHSTMADVICPSTAPSRNHPVQAPRAVNGASRTQSARQFSITTGRPSRRVHHRDRLKRRPSRFPIEASTGQRWAKGTSTQLRRLRRHGSRRSYIGHADGACAHQRQDSFAGRTLDTLSLKVVWDYNPFFLLSGKRMLTVFFFFFFLGPSLASR